MLGKRFNPVIGKFAGAKVPGGQTPASREGSTSTRSPLDHKVQSARCPKSYDFGGVGLAIVAALEKSGEIPGGAVAYGRKSRGSVPIPVNRARIPARLVPEPGSLEEEYTVVTRRRGGDNRAYTRVYSGEGEIRSSHRSNRRSLFMISPARLGDIIPAYPDSDFLSSCHFCRKKLNGKDIYMYRGEKGFCSTECRNREIAKEEEKQRENNCGSEISPAAGCSYTNPHMLPTGILAA